MKQFFLGITVFLCTLAPLSADERVMVNTGHNGRILDISLGEDSSRLFTSGEDGTVRVWDSESKQLVRKLQISHLPIVRVAHHPEKPIIALVETDRINTYHLTVWNYQNEEELYSQKIRDIPLHFDFSPKGTYLVYSMTDWKSLTFLESESGRTKHIFREGFGIVSDAYITDTEKTLLTYSPSGEIRYWNLENGQERGGNDDRRTESNLKNVHFLPQGNYIYLIGRKGSMLYFVDLYNGEVVAEKELRNITSISLDRKEEELGILSQKNSDTSFSAFSLESEGRKGFFKNNTISLSRSRSVRAPLLYNESSLYFGINDGSLYTRNLSDEKAELFAGPVLLSIHDIAFSEENIFLSSDKQFFSISSKAFTDINRKDDADRFSFRSSLYDMPIRGNTSLISLRKGSCFILPNERQEGSLQIYRFEDGEFSSFNEKISSPVETVGSYGDDLLFLEQNGTIRIVSADDGKTAFSYTSFGLQSVSEAYQGNLMAARNKTDMIGTPLLHLNPNTGETVPIDDSNILTFHLKYDDMTRSLYTLGYEERHGGLRTVLKQHSGRNYERTSTLLSYPGEDSEATLAVDPINSRLFTSLGFGKVHMYAWNGFTDLEAINHIPRSLYVHEGFLYSLNGDSSISVWNTDNGKHLMTIYIFEDFSWAVVPKSGEPFTRGGAERHIHTVYE